MYIFTFRQFKWIVTTLALILLVASCIIPIPSFQQSVLIACSLSLLAAIWIASMLSKKLCVWSSFSLAVVLSFSHFLLNFTSTATLVATLYAVSFLTLFTILVTNFEDSNLIQA